MQFENKIAVVTGGTTGIGEAACRELTGQGAVVYNLDISHPVQSESNMANFIPCDVRSKEQVKIAVNTVVQQAGRIDLAFLNAGILRFGAIDEIAETDMADIIETNLYGTIWSLREILPVMKKQSSGGSIVLMGSDQSMVGKNELSVYGLTKGAIAQLTKSTALDMAAFNIRVNCVCPGSIETPLYHKAIKEYSDRHEIPVDVLYRNFAAAQPLKRAGTPNEVAHAVAFLLSDKSAFTTGALLAVDGGYVCG